MAEKIQMVAGQLVTPQEPIIPYIEGDGVGPEIWQQAQKVLDQAVAVAYQGERKISWQKLLAGEAAFVETGQWLPPETVEIIDDCLVAIKGPLATPIGEGIRSLNVALRQALDLYACVRPVRYFPGVPSPLRHPERVAVTVFRENTEDIYAGIEFAAESPEANELIAFLKENFAVDKIRFPETSAIGIKPVSIEGTQRLVRSAMEYAVSHNKKVVTLVHKGNIMKFTEGGFRKWGYELIAAEYGDKTFSMREYEKIKKAAGKAEAEKEKAAALKSGKILINDIITDNFLQQMLLAPQDYQVVATLNLNGDYISDALAATVGGIGISPGGNINYQNGHAIFEATHGTAPNIAGLNEANPSSVILSGVLLLEYIGWREAAQLIEVALEQTIAEKYVTKDFADLMADAHEVSTAEFGARIIAAMDS
ncbi:NADP-dependent isocitrate dehydrogenase [Enterococcus sp. LJL90]